MAIKLLLEKVWRAIINPIRHFVSNGQEEVRVAQAGAYHYVASSSGRVQHRATQHHDLTQRIIRLFKY